MPELPLYTDWQSGGETYYVETGRNPNESTASWEARHRAAVDAMQIDFPPDPLMIKHKQRSGWAFGNRPADKHLFSLANKKLVGLLSGALAGGFGLAQAESVPAWMRVAGGVVGLVAVGILGLLGYEPLRAYRAKRKGRKA